MDELFRGSLILQQKLKFSAIFKIEFNFPEVLSNDEGYTN